MNEQNCGNCRFFFSYKDEFPDLPDQSEFRGGCRRYPKVHYVERKPSEKFYDDCGDSGGAWFNTPCGFPYHEADEWCGEWKKKRDKKTVAVRNDAEG